MDRQRYRLSSIAGRDLTGKGSIAVVHLPGWPKQRADDPPRWWAQTFALVVTFVWALLLALTAIFVHARGPVGFALDVALGTDDPFSAHGASVPAVALAVFSWLLVPAVVGTIVALLTQVLLTRARRLSMQDFQTALDNSMREMKEEVRQEVLSQLKNQGSGETVSSSGHD
jgi:hypothetical protein